MNETLPGVRLNPAQVAQYSTEGYLTFKEPVLAAPKFDALKNYFEGILADLPPAERPEAMDVPHFMHPKLLEWAFDPAVLGIVEAITGPRHRAVFVALYLQAERKRQASSVARRFRVLERTYHADGKSAPCGWRLTLRHAKTGV